MNIRVPDQLRTLDVNVIKLRLFVFRKTEIWKIEFVRKIKYEEKDVNTEKMFAIHKYLVL